MRSGRSFADRDPAGAVRLPLTLSTRLTGPLQNATEMPSRLVVGDGCTCPPAGIAEGWIILSAAIRETALGLHSAPSLRRRLLPTVAFRMPVARRRNSAGRKGFRLKATGP